MIERIIGVKEAYDKARFLADNPEASYQKQRYNNLKKQHLCPICEIRVDKNHVYCDKCKKIRNKKYPYKVK